MGGTGSAALRERFLGYFEARGHVRVPSSGLVPTNDPTLLFTNAGMNQFKDVFTGQARLPFRRATSSQKCVRAGGKHNDLEQVGRTPRHHTFFEMLGNFSFGDYFKREAIGYAWELITGEMGLDPARLWVTVFREDAEAAALWAEVANLPRSRIVPLGEKDNFWAMGDTGPCGPCSEIHYDRGEEHRCGAPRCGIGACDCPRWLEIWNLVFMQFERAPSGALSPLPRPSIDTGMGLERIASVLQGVDSNFDTDLFRPLLAAVERLSGRSYDPGAAGFPFRVIADHARACTFLIADGVLPANEGRGYVLRRILRRAVRFGRQLGLDGPFLHRLVDPVREAMAGAYPEIDARAGVVETAIRTEEERFGETLSAGLTLLERELADATAAGRTVLPGEMAFRLYDTYGFPLDLTVDAAAERGLGVDTAGFERALAAQRERARADRRARAISYRAQALPEDVAPTRFLGYETLRADAQVLAVSPAPPVPDGEGAESAEGAWLVVLDQTPFYPEGGGQVADQGWLQGEDGERRWLVRDTRRTARGAIAHVVAGDGEGLYPGARVVAEVDAARRRAVAANHSATHLLHHALRQALGDSVHQAGSLVAPDRLRFDFTAARSLTPDQVHGVEDAVNELVLAALPVEWFETGLEEARRMGAMALFGEKYGERVRVVRMGPSLELCGGTHVANTAEVGLFLVTQEAGIGSGVRRIEAVTGRGFLQTVRRRLGELSALAATLRTGADGVGARVAELQRRLADAEAALAAARQQEARRDALALLREARALGPDGARVVSGRVDAAGAEELRRLADLLRAELRSGAVLLVAEAGEGAQAGVLLALTPDLVARGLHAGRTLSRAVAAAGGKGGGRPDLAQGGCPREGIPQAMEAALAALRQGAAGGGAA